MAFQAHIKMKLFEGYMLQITATVSLSHCHSWQVLRKRLFTPAGMWLHLEIMKTRDVIFGSNL